MTCCGLLAGGDRLHFGAAWAFEEAAKLAADWAAGAGYLSDAEGRPIDPKLDHETAGDDISAAIRAAVGPAGE